MGILVLLLLGCGHEPPGAAPVPLAPGEFLSPLVRLQRLQGEEDHLHIDELRLREDGLLLQASYTFGVIDAREPHAMRYLSQGLRHEIPGARRPPGAIHLASRGDLVFTTHRGTIRNPAFLSGWDIRDPAAPVQLPVLQEPGISYEGIDTSGDALFVGLHEDGLGVYRFDRLAGFRRTAALSGFHNAWGVCARGSRVFVADGEGGLVTVDADDPDAPRIAGRVQTGGLATDVVVDGDLAYVAAGSAGLVVVSVADFARPRIVGRAAMPGAAVRVAYADQRVFVAAWNDARVYDVSEPSRPLFVGAVRLTQRDDDIADGDRPASTSRVLGIAARGDDVFVGNWHVLYSYRLHAERRAPSLHLPEMAALVDFGPLAPGASRTLPFELVNQGTAPLTVLRAWVAGAGKSAFEVSPQQLRIEPGQAATLSLRFRPGSEQPVEASLVLLSDDPLEPRRSAYLVGNRPGIGVGRQLPETRARLLDGSAWSSTETAGQVLLLSYFATF